MNKILHHLCILALTTTALLVWSCERENFDVIDPLTGEVIPDTTFCALTLETSFVSGILVADVNDGQVPYNYLWSTGETAPLIEVEEPGTYGVTVTDAVGCQIVGTQRVSSPEECDLITITIREEERDGDVALVASAENAILPVFYSWGEDLPQGNTFIPEGPGTYEILILDGGGCIVSETYVFE